MKLYTFSKCWPFFRPLDLWFVDTKRKETTSNHASIRTRMFGPETKISWLILLFEEDYRGWNGPILLHLDRFLITSDTKLIYRDIEVWHPSFCLHFVRFISCHIVSLHFMLFKPLLRLRFVLFSLITYLDYAVSDSSSYDYEDA